MHVDRQSHRTVRDAARALGVQPVRHYRADSAQRPVLPQRERMPYLAGVFHSALCPQGGRGREGDDGDLSGFHVDLPHHFQLSARRMARAGRARRMDRYGDRLVREGGLHDSEI